MVIHHVHVYDIIYNSPLGTYPKLKNYCIKKKYEEVQYCVYVHQDYLTYTLLIYI